MPDLDHLLASNNFYDLFIAVKRADKLHTLLLHHYTFYCPANMVSDFPLYSYWSSSSWSEKAREEDDDDFLTMGMELNERMD